MTVIVQRNNTQKVFRSNTLAAHLNHLTNNLDTKYLNIEIICDKIQGLLPDKVTSTQLVELISETLASMATIHPDHARLAARVYAKRLQKVLPRTFSECVLKLSKFKNSKTNKYATTIDPEVAQIVSNNKKLLDSEIISENDYKFSYFGLKTLEKSYLLKINGEIVETPQYLLMRVALGIHKSDLKSAIETYKLMSNRYFIHASPTLFNSGTVNPYLSSCFLLGIVEDSIDGIYKTLHQSALISKSAGGLGIHVSNIRSSGSYILGTNGTSNGLVPMLRVYNNTARYVDQGGNKRPGAFAIYLEPWHSDVFDFLNLRKNHGKEELRARDLFLALWIPDLFMEKVEKNLDWHLFSPDSAPGLNEVYGKEFNDLYEKYVNEGVFVKKVKAQKLWAAILEAQTETGGPFMLYKDACNYKSNQKNLGTIKSSNLCCEVVEYSSPEEIAVCNLASIALPSFIHGGKEPVSFDFGKLHEITKTLTRNLNRVIDVGKYPLEQCEYSNKKNRPIAIGVQGLSDLFMELRLPFDSKGAKELNSQIFETIYHGAVEASMELAMEDGKPYDSFDGSPASKGQLQFDLWNYRPGSGLFSDWDELKSKVVKYGLKNSLLVAPMPTASTSQILGFNECFEPLTSNLYTRRVLSGEFQMVNEYLVRDLIKLGLWTETMKNEIVRSEGSVQHIEEIPQDLKQLYKTVWEISQKVIIDMAADRAPFIDQSQSMNIFMKEPTMGKLTSMHFYGWKKGLKTGMYYLRTQAASSAIKFTVTSPPPAASRQPGVQEEQQQHLEPAVKVTETVSEDQPSPPKRRKVSRPDQDQDQDQDQLDPDLDQDPVDIHSETPLSCDFNSPGNCESCSG